VPIRNELKFIVCVDGSLDSTMDCADLSLSSCQQLSNHFDGHHEYRKTDQHS